MPEIANKFDYRKHRLSLVAVADAMRIASRGVREEFVTVEKMINDLMDKKSDEAFKGDGKSLDPGFDNLKEILENILKDAEKVKSLDRHILYDKIGDLRRVCNSWVRIEWDKNPEKEKEHADSQKVLKKIEEIIDEVEKQIKDEIKTERRLLKGKKLRVGKGAALLHTDKGLARDQVHKANDLDSVIHKESDLYTALRNSIAYIVKVTEGTNSIAPGEFDTVVELMLEYIESLDKEFEFLFDIEIENDWTEYRIFKEIKDLDKKRNNEKLYKIIHDFEKDFVAIIRQDYRIIKREEAEIEKTTEEIEKELKDMDYMTNNNPDLIIEIKKEIKNAIKHYGKLINENTSKREIKHIIQAFTRNLFHHGIKSKLSKRDFDNEEFLRKLIFIHLETQIKEFIDKIVDKTFGLRLDYHGKNQGKNQSYDYQEVFNSGIDVFDYLIIPICKKTKTDNKQQNIYDIFSLITYSLERMEYFLFDTIKGWNIPKKTNSPDTNYLEILDISSSKIIGFSKNINDFYNNVYDKIMRAFSDQNNEHTYINKFNHYYNMGKIKNIDKLMAKKFYEDSNSILIYINDIVRKIDNNNIESEKDNIKNYIIKYQKLLTISRVHWYSEFIFELVNDFIANGIPDMMGTIKIAEGQNKQKPSNEFNSLCLKFIENVTTNFHKMKDIIQSPGYPHFVEKH